MVYSQRIHVIIKLDKSLAQCVQISCPIPQAHENCDD